MVIRFPSNLKCFRPQHDSPTTSSDKICRAFVISSNQYGLFRPTRLSSQLLCRSDSLFSYSDAMFNNKVAAFQRFVNINSQSRLNKEDLLEYYLRTYNPQFNNHK